MWVIWVVSMSEVCSSALPGAQHIVSILQTVALNFLAPLRHSILKCPSLVASVELQKTNLKGAWSQGILASCVW